ncbi:hypothetical protein Ancab_033777 [Ancistrocladus abbreviatus]
MTVKVEEEGDSTKRWGTWEQLILGGAVLRHGTNHWDIVASELHTRSLHPFLFTPEACKAKYEDLQLHYSGNTAWFEELRKQRVAELKRALEKSEDSIGSLESKLESLEAEKGSCGNADCSCSQTESSFPFPKSEENELSGKYMSKDRLSAGSFTQETHANWLPRCQTAVKGLAEQAETKPRLQSPNKEHLLIIDKLAQAIQPEGGVSIRRKRGKRKRKDCSKHVMEGSVGENNLLSSVNVGATTLLCKENLTSDCGETVRCSDANDHDQGTGKEEFDDLMGFLDSVMQNEHASVFRRRLDSQKRARYKKTVRQHMDLDIIRSKITRKSITSAEELLRDLLLIASNALIFYSKCTREYKCASRLRGLVTERLQQHYKALAMWQQWLLLVLVLSSQNHQCVSHQQNAEVLVPLIANLRAWQSTPRMLVLQRQKELKVQEMLLVPLSQWNHQPKGRKPQGGSEVKLDELNMGMLVCKLKHR